MNNLIENLCTYRCVDCYKNVVKQIIAGLQIEVYIHKFYVEILKKYFKLFTAASIAGKLVHTNLR